MTRHNGVKQKKRALLVVDVQRGFISNYTQKCLPHIHNLLESHSFDLVIATRFFNPPQSPFRRQINWHKFSDEIDVALDPVVAAYADVILNKSTYGAGQPLLDTITNYDINEVTVVGIDTDVCVLINAAYLFDNDVPVCIDLQGCATNGGPQAEAAAHRLLQRYVGASYVLGA